MEFIAIILNNASEPVIASLRDKSVGPIVCENLDSIDPKLADSIVSGFTNNSHLFDSLDFLEPYVSQDLVTVVELEPF